MIAHRVVGRGSVPDFVAALRPHSVRWRWRVDASHLSAPPPLHSHAATQAHAHTQPQPQPHQGIGIGIGIHTRENPSCSTNHGVTARAPPTTHRQQPRDVNVRHAASNVPLGVWVAVLVVLPRRLRVDGKRNQGAAAAGHGGVRLCVQPVPVEAGTRQRPNSGVKGWLPQDGLGLGRTPLPDGAQRQARTSLCNAHQVGGLGEQPGQRGLRVLVWGLCRAAVACAGVRSCSLAQSQRSPFEPGTRRRQQLGVKERTRRCSPCSCVRACVCVQRCVCVYVRACVSRDSRFQLRA